MLTREGMGIIALLLDFEGSHGKEQCLKRSHGSIPETSTNSICIGQRARSKKS